MSHDDQGQAGPSGHKAPVSSSVQGRQATGAEFQGISQKVSILVEQDQDHQEGRKEVITEPTAVSRPGLFAGEDYFCQDKLYYLSPFKSGRCGTPSRQHLEEDQGHYK